MLTKLFSVCVCVCVCVSVCVCRLLCGSVWHRMSVYELHVCVCVCASYVCACTACVCLCVCAAALLYTDLLWAHGVPTLVKVGAEQREGHEVPLHGHILTALEEHLLKHPRVEAAGIKNNTHTPGC